MTGDGYKHVLRFGRKKWNQEVSGLQCGLLGKENCQRWCWREKTTVVYGGIFVGNGHAGGWTVVVVVAAMVS